jgi:hypothetical protein
MKTINAVMAVMALLSALLLLGGTSTSAGQSVSALEPRPAAPNVMFGGGYTLTSVALCASVSMVGDGYVLTSLTAPAGSEDACCCTFVPFARR